MVEDGGSTFQEQLLVLQSIYSGNEEVVEDLDANRYNMHIYCQNGLFVQFEFWLVQEGF